MVLGRGIYPQPALCQVLAKSPSSLAHLKGDIRPGTSGKKMGKCWLDLIPPPQTPPPHYQIPAWGLVSLGVRSDSEGYFTRCMILNGISTICSTP